MAPIPCIPPRLVSSKTTGCIAKCPSILLPLLQLTHRSGVKLTSDGPQQEGQCREGQDTRECRCRCSIRELKFVLTGVSKLISRNSQHKHTHVARLRRATGLKTLHDPSHSQITSVQHFHDELKAFRTALSVPETEHTWQAIDKVRLEVRTTCKHMIGVSAAEVRPTRKGGGTDVKSPLSHTSHDHRLPGHQEIHCSHEGWGLQIRGRVCSRLEGQRAVQGDQRLCECGGVSLLVSSLFVYRSPLTRV